MRKRTHFGMARLMVLGILFIPICSYAKPIGTLTPTTQTVKVDDHTLPMYTYLNTYYVNVKDFTRTTPANLVKTPIEFTTAQYDNHIAPSLKGTNNEQYIAIRELLTYRQLDTKDNNYTITAQTSNPYDKVKVDTAKVNNLTDDTVDVTIQAIYCTGGTTFNVATREYTLAAQESVAHNYPEKDLVAVYILKLDGKYYSIGQVSAKNSNLMERVHKYQNQTLEQVFPQFKVEYTTTSTYNGVAKGAIVKLVSDKQVQLDNGSIVDFPKSKLRMNRTNRTFKEEALDEDIVAFANKQGYQSNTKYLVWLDMYRQRTYVLQGEKGNWVLVKSLLSSAGKNTTPTPLGEYKLTKKVPSFGQNKGYCCKNAFGFIGTTYLFHSTIFDKTGSYLLEGKGVLGNQASEGCIRFEPAQAKWFYDTLIPGTTVIIR